MMLSTSIDYKSWYNKIIDQYGTIRWVNGNGYHYLGKNQPFLTMYSQFFIAQFSDGVFPCHILDGNLIKYNLKDAKYIFTTSNSWNYNSIGILGNDGNIYALDMDNNPYLLYSGGDVIRIEKAYEAGFIVYKSDGYIYAVDVPYYADIRNGYIITLNKITNNVAYCTGAENYYWFIHKNDGSVYIIYRGMFDFDQAAIRLNGQFGLPNDILRMAAFDEPLEPGRYGNYVIALGGDGILYGTVIKKNIEIVENFAPIIDQPSNVRFKYMGCTSDDTNMVVLCDTNNYVYTFTRNSNVNSENKIYKRPIGYVENKGFLYVTDSRSDNFVSKTESNDRNFYLKTTASLDSNQGNVVNYVTTWGTTEETATANTFSSKSMTFDSSNYANYNTLLTQAAEAEIAACKAFLDIPDLVLPANTSQTYTKNGLSYTLAVNYAKGSAKNEVITTSYIDGTIFGTATTETYSTQALANTGLSTLTTNKINAMKTACNNSPANTSEIYTKGGMNYTITTTYTKAAGNKTVTTKTNLDGAQWSSITANVSSSTLATDCTTLQTNAATQVANLKALLDDSPVNVEQTYTKGTGEGSSQNFVMRVQYTKSAGATTATCNVTCDGAVYSSSSLSVNAATLTSDLNSATSTGNTKLGELRTKLSGAPANTNEVYTVNGFNYNLGTAYSKTGDDTTDTSKAVLDGAFYGASNKSLTLATFDNDVRELESAAATSKAAVQAMLDTSPANASETYTVRGLNFAIGTVYSKAAGNTTANITTTLDGSNHSVSTQTVAMANLSSNLTSASNTAAADVAALKLLLDTKVPADTTNDDYTVDGFTYKCGARHEKSAGGSTVITQIVLDGNVVDSFNTTISAANTSADLDTLNNTITTRVNGLKANLIGIPADSESYTSNGTNFTLRVVYTKNPNNTISIQSYIDNDPYGDPYITIFDYQDESDYLAIGQSKIQDMKDSIDEVSAAFVNTSEVYTVHNNMSFRVGISYEKAAGSSIVNVFQMLDGAKVGTPNSVRYDVSDTSAVSIQAANDLASLKARLDGAPSNYTNNIAYGSMVFAVGSNFSKVEDNPNVTITTMLDGSAYGSSTTKAFDITNISELTTTASTKESTLKEILGTVPQDTTEIFNIRRFSFAITKSWIKNANSSAVTSMVKMDGTQYDQHRTLTFDITDIASLSTYNNNLAQSLKDKLLTLIPEDIHTTYSRNQFNFIIDAYFSKQANSNIVTIEYNIDSADLTGNSVTALNATTTNSDEQTVVTNNSLESGVTTLNASISDAMTELNENLKQLTYNANEEVAARILGTNPRRSDS